MAGLTLRIVPRVSAELLLSLLLKYTFRLYWQREQPSLSNYSLETLQFSIVILLDNQTPIDVSLAVCVF